MADCRRLRPGLVCCQPDQPGVGRIILRSASHMTELFRLSNLNSEDFRILVMLLQSEKPLYWDSHADCLRTAHPQSHDAEPVGEQEGHGG